MWLPAVASRPVAAPGGVVSGASGPALLILTQFIFVLLPPMASRVSRPSVTSTVAVPVLYSVAAVAWNAGSTVTPSARTRWLLS